MNKSVLSFARNASFIRSFLFLSLLLFCSFSFAEGFVIDNRTGKIIPGSNRWPTNGLKTVYSPNHGFYQTYSKAADLTTLRDTVRGVRSAGGVPATISRTVPTSTVLSKVLTNGRLAGRRLIPYVGWGLLAYDLINLAATNDGYTWSDEHQDWVKIPNGDAYVVVVSNEHNSIPNQAMNVAGLNVWCSSVGELVSPFGARRTCKFVGTFATRQEAVQAQTAACRAMSRTLDDGRVVQGYHVLVQDYCRSKEGIPMLEPSAVKIIPVLNAPITYSDSQIQESDISDAAKWIEAANLSDSDWSAPKVHVLPGTIVNSQPFTDKDGKPKQARWEFYDCEDGQSCVRETLTDRPDLQPNSPAAPAPDNPPATGTDTAPGVGGQSGSQSGDQTGTDQPPPFDLCREYPDSLACQKMGQPDPGQFDDIRIPVHVDNRTWQEDLFLPSTGVCPAPKTFHVMGKPVSVSYQPLCSFMETIRFIVLICFIVSAAYISFGGLKQG